MNTTISISKHLQEEIKEFGSKGETYDQILKKIMEYVKERELERLLMSSEGTIPIEEAIARAKKKWQKS